MLIIIEENPNPGNIRVGMEIVVMHESWIVNSAYSARVLIPSQDKGRLHVPAQSVANVDIEEISKGM